MSLTVVGNEVASPDANTNHIRTVSSLSTANMFAQATLKTAGASLGVGARFPGSAVTETGYVWRYNGTDCQLFAVSAGSFTAIGSAYAAVLSAGAVLRIEVEGTSIRGLVDGVTRATATNSAVTAGGCGSLRISGTVGRLDDFAMGPLEVAVVPPATGTVTGSWAFAETVTGPEGIPGHGRGQLGVHRDARRFPAVTRRGRGSLVVQ